MNDISIRADKLGKQYTIGGPQEPYRTLRDTLAGAATAPIRSVRSVFWPSETRASGRSRDFWALKDVSFEIRRGQVVGIIGRNGAGKSTLLKILSRITEPTEGRAELRGRIGTLLEVGTGFHPELTGRENIFLNGTILGMKRAEIARTFDEIVAFAEVERFIDTPVKHYSSGMYLRLAFAVAAHLDPEILIVDEVLAVGDAQFQKKSLGKMEDVARQGRTVLFVSHNMAAIRTLCTDAILLRSGRVEMIGASDPVIAHYLAASTDDLSTSVELPASGPDAPGSASWLRFSTLEGKPQSEFRIGEPWRAVLEFELRRPVEHMIAAIGLLTFESIPLITYWSAPRDLPAGEYQVEYRCDLPLAAGDVQFAVGLSSHERTFYYANGVGHVSISAIALDNQPLRSTGAGLLASSTRPAIEALES
jgi:lipopolysaccharide transport system ATP-binding protein